MRSLVATTAALTCLGYGATSLAAITIGTTNDANALASALTSTSGAVTILSATYSGHGDASGTYSEGPLGIANGAILTSGSAQLALPPDDGGATGQDNGTSGDALCDALIPGYESQDAVKLTIVFELAPLFDGISFQSVFGSEEYPEWVGSPYNDVYGVYLDGTQVAFDSGGNPITINGPFFSGSSVVVSPATETEYDGSTGILTTQAPSSSGVHTLEIVICDAGDHILDSGVFIAGLNGCVGSNCTGTVPCELIDNDADGTSSCDDCDDTNPAVNPSASETCNGIDDDCDTAIDEDDVCCPDADADDVCDPVDNCDFIANPDQADTDADGLGDVCDNCAGVSNADQADQDGDGDGDVCDNCLSTPNPDQGDGDGDGAGNACDTCDGPLTDTDSDGFADACDTCPTDPANDEDADGICGGDDLCPGTALPEGVPTVKLGVNRFAQTDADSDFETVDPNGNGPGKTYSMADTGGCSCEQIIEELDLGEGHSKFGCSISAMDTWVSLVSGG